MTSAGKDLWRIVTTGRGESGAATIADDHRQADQRLPSGRFLAQLWSLDPGRASPPADSGLFPQPNGVRLWLFTVPPNTEDGTATPFHRTPTIDMGFVLRGSVCLEMENGTRTVLHPGDSFVQLGTAHRWTNSGAEPARIGLVVMGMTTDQLDDALNAQRSEAVLERTDGQPDVAENN